MYHGKSIIDAESAIGEIINLSLTNIDKLKDILVDGVSQGSTNHQLDKNYMKKYLKNGFNFS